MCPPPNIDLVVMFVVSLFTFLVGFTLNWGIGRGRLYMRYIRGWNDALEHAAKLRAHPEVFMRTDSK